VKLCEICSNFGISAKYRRPPQNALQTTARRTADQHRTAQDTLQNTAGRGK